MKKYLLISLFSFSVIPVFACLILFITDGKNILVANHEDWYAKDAELVFVPANGKKMGMLYYASIFELTGAEKLLKYLHKWICLYKICIRCNFIIPL